MTISIRRAATDADWKQAVALHHVEWMWAWTAFDPIAEQPSLRPGARGGGVADRVAAAAVELAAARGRAHVWLETVRSPMDPASAVSRRNGIGDVPWRPAEPSMPGVAVTERPVTPLRCSA